MKTAITELFGIEHPIIQGGMHYVGFAELAAAVSNAGGLGIITGLTQPTPEAAGDGDRALPRHDRQAVRREPHVPADVHARRPIPNTSQAIIEGGVRIVETAGRSPRAIHARAEGGRHQGHPQMHLGAAFAEGRAIGCDAVSVDGFECGGHPGEDDVPNLILLPRAAEELKIPFVASGGMADGRSLVAALALGADGMNMGTRFIATQEAPVHENVKQAHRRRRPNSTRA